MSVAKHVIKKGMYMIQPATRWQDALPSGNGSLGALVYGHIKNEIIVLNHDRLFLESPKPTLNPVNQYLPEFRQKLLLGKYREGIEFFANKLKENYIGSTRPDPYQPAFDIKLDMETNDAFTNYRRSLDFETGEVSVEWREKDTEFRRKLFVSRADDSVIMQISTSGRSVDCRLTLIPHGAENATGMGSGKDVKGDELPFDYEKAANNNWITFKAIYKDGREFGGLARVLTKGGTVKAEQGAIVVNGAEEVLLTVKLFVNEESSSAINKLKSEMLTMPVEYDMLLERHVELHRTLFNRMSLELDSGEGCMTSNEQLLLKAYNGEVPIELIQKMFDYGRYLLISSSRPGGMPANLQGLWNGDYSPAWQSDYHNDENIQMNYWAALPGNLAETTLPYFDYYEFMIKDYQVNARAVYGCRGIFAPIAQTTHGLIYGSNIWVAWTAGAGWLSQLFYDYWLFTGNKEFLKNRAVPFLKEVAYFYEDFLVEGEDGKFAFIPSLSPENTPSIPNGSLVTINATMDVAVAREVLTNLCKACEYLGIEQDGVKRWKGILDKLPDYEINEDGAIKEWIHDDLPDNYHHRHQSHIYPLFPGLEVTEESNKDLFNAMRTAVEKRLVIGLTSQTGWSFAHMANIYARLGEGERALECLEILCRSCVGPNLFTYHNDWRSQGLTMFWGHGSQPPFQIDANFGLTSAVLEMLVFSAPGIIKLLPAVPEKWLKGSAKGILCRGGIEVSIKWDMEKRKLDVVFLARLLQKVTIKLPFIPIRFDYQPDQVIVMNSSYGEKYRVLNLQKDKMTMISVWF